MSTSPIIRLGSDALKLQALTGLIGHDPSCGAVASFTGHVRASDGLTALELMHHPVLTAQALQQIGEAAMKQFGLNGLLIAHRHGRMIIGEPIVHIVASSGHRRDALDAVSYTIDLLKTRAPFWKREWRGDEAVWIEPSAADQAATEEWLETSS